MKTILSLYVFFESCQEHRSNEDAKRQDQAIW